MSQKIITRSSYMLGLFFVCVFSTDLSARTCSDWITKIAPDSRYEVNGDTVRDKLTELVWARCSLGQIYNVATELCEGSAETYSWSQALQQAEIDSTASHSDWRLPNIKELSSLVETACYNPAINVMAFPNTLSFDFWSSSATNGYTNYAWLVKFDRGDNYRTFKDYSLYVRLVRSSGQ